jgi:hypothetical protein
LRRRAARLYSLDIVPPSSRGAMTALAGRLMAMLKISGDKMPPAASR